MDRAERLRALATDARAKARFHGLRRDLCRAYERLAENLDRLGWQARDLDAAERQLMEVASGLDRLVVPLVNDAPAIASPISEIRPTA